MIKKLISDKFIQKLANTISESVEKSFSSYKSHTNKQLDQIVTHVEALRLELKSLDERITIKEVKDRSEYGHVQYKLNSLQSELVNKKKNNDAKRGAIARPFSPITVPDRSRINPIICSKIPFDEILPAGRTAFSPVPKETRPITLKRIIVPVAIAAVAT